MRDDEVQANRRFHKPATDDQAKDAGMAVVLACLLAGYWGGRQQFYLMAIFTLIANMVSPGIYKPVAVVWFWFSGVLGKAMSELILTAIYFALVVPVGCIRRLLGYDPLQLKSWKKDGSSVFKVRDHTFEREDIEHPY
jgi:hypothetical protein